MQNRSDLSDTIRMPAHLAQLPLDTPILLALSGGADSTALLHLLAERRQQEGFLLVAAHVDHGIRGDEAKRDRDFCESLAKQYGIELCVLEADVPALAEERRQGIEETAREVRYAFFAQLMQERSIPLLVTAHHADDQAETVLFRLCRGTSMAGLSGIAPVRPFANGYLTRPLLQVSKREILAYCHQKGLEFVTDSTNGDTAYARNRIRAELIPVMEELFPGAVGRIGAMADSLREDEALLSSLADGLIQSATAEDGGLLIEPMVAANPSLRRRVLAAWVRMNTELDAERVHLEALEQLLISADADTEVALHGGFCAVCEFGRLRVYSPSRMTAEPFCYPFLQDGSFVLPSGITVSVKENAAPTKVNKLSTHSYLNLNAISAIIKNSVFWRSKKDGDKILMGGMHRKLRRLYREAGIPPRWRDAIPLLCDEKGILWAPFVGVRDGVSVSGGCYLLQVTLPISLETR